MHQLSNDYVANAFISECWGDIIYWVHAEEPYLPRALRWITHPKGSIDEQRIVYPAPRLQCHVPILHGDVPDHDSPSNILNAV